MAANHSTLGPGSYNIAEQEQKRQKFICKHEKLLARPQQRKGLVKVGQNLVKASSRMPEFEETQKKLQD